MENEVQIFNEILDKSISMAILVAVIYFMFKYFTKEMSKMQEILTTKDSELKNLHAENRQLLQQVFENNKELETLIQKNLERIISKDHGIEMKLLQIQSIITNEKNSSWDGPGRS